MKAKTPRRLFWSSLGRTYSALLHNKWAAARRPASALDFADEELIESLRHPAYFGSGHYWSADPRAVL